MPQVQDDGNEFTLQLNGATPHFNVICTFLNENLPNRWIGRSSADDLHLHHWPPRSPDLTLLDFFLWGFIKDKVLVPPLPKRTESTHYRGHKWGKRGNAAACMEWVGFQDWHMPYYERQPYWAFMRYVQIWNTPIYINHYHVMLLIIPVQWHHEISKQVMTHGIHYFIDTSSVRKSQGNLEASYDSQYTLLHRYFFSAEITGKSWYYNYTLPTCVLPKY